MIRREQIVAEARAWKGTPFQHQGRMKGAACDCIGLVICVARALGVIDFDVTGYPAKPDGVTLKRELDRHLEPVPHARPGDVLLFRIRKRPQHVAIMTTPKSMIHAYRGASNVVETGIGPWWRDRVVAAYRFPGVEG